LKIVFVIVVIACANDIFNLVPWAHVAGVFNVSDVGIALILMSVIALFIRYRIISVMNNPITWIIILYFFMAAAQASLAAINYGQSMLDGAMLLRHQLYYLSFFLFLYLFKSFEDIRAILNTVAVIGIALFMLALINYSGIVIFHHQWADGHGVRGGVERGFIPGMDIVSLALMWFTSAWGTAASSRKTTIGSVIMIGAHFFRQTRSRIIAATAVLLFMMLYRKEYKLVLASVIIGIVLIAALQAFLPGNFFYDLYTTSFTDVTESEGTWTGRSIQLEAAWNIFLQNPLFGSGSIALKGDSGLMVSDTDYNVRLIASKSDLGYAHWLKSYGIVGLIWLFGFLYSVWRYAQRSLHLLGEKDKQIALFIMSYTVFIVISSITLNYFMMPHRIILVCMAAAISVRIHQLARLNTIRS
jgi:O-antigen ligase